MTQATPQLVRILIRQNEEALRGLRAAPPSDVNGPADQRHRMTIEEMFAQTEILRERLEFLLRQPQERRTPRSYRDIDPRPTGAFGEQS